MRMKPPPTLTGIRSMAGQPNGRPILPPAIAHEVMILEQKQAARAGALINSAIPLAVAMIRQGVPADQAAEAAVRAAEKAVNLAVQLAKSHKDAPAETPSSIIQ